MFGNEERGEGLEGHGNASCRCQEWIKVRTEERRFGLWMFNYSPSLLVNGGTVMCFLFSEIFFKLILLKFLN